MSKQATRTILGGFISLSFIGSLAALYGFPVPDENSDLIVFMLGQLAGFMGAVMAFNFGTSQGSVDKAQLLERRPKGTPADPVSVEEQP